MPICLHDFNGIDPEAKTEFYQHDQNWTNRLILGDSLQVMARVLPSASLYADKCSASISTRPTARLIQRTAGFYLRPDVKDGKIEEISREPEQVRAFGDMWKEDGIHFHLTYSARPVDGDVGLAD